MDEQKFLNLIMYSRDKIVPYQLESIRLLSRIMFTSVVQQSLLENGGDNTS